MWQLIICTLALHAHAQDADQRIVFHDNPPFPTPPQQNPNAFNAVNQQNAQQQQQQPQYPQQQFQSSVPSQKFPQVPTQSSSTVTRVDPQQPVPQAASASQFSPHEEATDIVNQFYPPVEQIQNSYLDAISQGNERFALSFFKKMGDIVPNHDFMVSPFSVWALLASAAEGAGPSTLEEFKTVLNLRDFSQLGPVFSEIRNKLIIKTPTVDLTVFQALFYNQSLAIKEDYKKKVQSSYHTEIFPLEGSNLSEQIKTVNNIIREATDGYHQAAFEANDLKVTSLLLLSLIHFRGQWRFPFNKTYTRTEPFYDEQGVPAGQVEMMFQRTFIPFAPIQKLESHVIDLPYGDQNRLRMLVILPRKNVNLLQVLQKLETSITVTEIFDELRKSVQQFEDEEIEVHLPKFNTTNDFILNAVLQQMGMHEAFSSGADFGKINPNIYLTRITHKSKIMVDEEGTVASSITAGLFANKSSGPRFYANRPFIYLIVDRVTKLVLFCGQMRNNPVETKPRPIRNERQ